MEKLKLWEKTPLFDESIGQEEPALMPYLLKDGKKHGAVIVCPGGGYSHKAAHEGGPIALRLNEQGINALVLDYRVAPYRHPAPLLDALRAIRYVRYHAEKLGVLPDKIGILGFSAGGHLTCTAATLYDKGNPEAEDPIDRVSARPDVFIPCYPVADGGISGDGGYAACLYLAHGGGQRRAGGKQSAAGQGAGGAQCTGIDAHLSLWAARRRAGQ